MKKRVLWLSLACVLIMLFPGAALGGDPNPGIISPSLMAGQEDIPENRAGIVRIWADCDNIYFHFSIKSSWLPGVGWCIEEYHLHLAASPEDFPMSGSGNPKIGNFDYQETFPNCFHAVTVAIPRGDWGRDCSPVYVALHASVVGPDGQETAWLVRCGDLNNPEFQFPGRAWGAFLELGRDFWNATDCSECS